VTIFMFPGQSSADPAMIARARRMPAASRVAERACTVLGDATASRYLGASTPLESNRDVQISVFLATQMFLEALSEEGIDADLSVGLSLGEYSHLVHIGALTFDDALRLIVARGAAFDRSPAGVMISVVGPDQHEVEEALFENAHRGVIVISNFNSPTQHVLAGESAAVRYVAKLLEEDTGAQATEIEARVPMHSPLLDATAAEFRRHLEAAPWRIPVRPYVPNVSGDMIDHPTPDDFIDHLTAHVSRPVQWRRSMELLASRHPGAAFVEVGPGLVLHNILSRRWLDVARFATDSRRDDDPDMRWRQTVETLRDRA
jgi:[acyl-carrier-protein] S-malonyltransferase